MIYLPLFKEDKPHFHTSGGQLAVGFKIYTYLAGTDTPVQVYSDPSGATPYQNPIVLDGRGEPSGHGIYADPDISYKVVLKTPDDAVVWSMDGIKCAGVAEVKPEIFYVTPNETTRAEIMAAVDNGMVPVVKASNGTFVFFAFPAQVQPDGASIVATWEFSTPLKYDGSFIVYRLDSSGNWSTRPMVATVNEDD